MRTASFLFLTFALAGCRLPDREGMAPLPDNSPPLTFFEMMARARGQAGSALDAYYIDAWLDLEQAAHRLEQTARLLPRCTEIPDSLKGKLETEAEQLRQDAAKLGEAARARNATAANEAMQRIHARVRQLRPQEKALPEPKPPEPKPN